MTNDEQKMDILHRGHIAIMAQKHFIQVLDENNGGANLDTIAIEGMVLLGSKIFSTLMVQAHCIPKKEWDAMMAENLAFGRRMAAIIKYRKEKLRTSNNLNN